MTLQQKTIRLMILAVIFPLSMLGWLAYGQLKTLSEQKTLSQMVTVLSQIELQLSQHLNTAKANVELFANNNFIAQYLLTEDEGDRYELLQPALLSVLGDYQQAYPNYYEIRLLLPDGYEDTRSTLKPLPNVTGDERATSYFLGMQAAEADIYTTYFHNPDNHEYSLLVAKRIKLRNRASDPLTAQPTLRGYLVVTIDLEFLHDQQRHTRFGKHGSILFTDHRGEWIFGPHAEDHHSSLPTGLFGPLVSSIADASLTRIPYNGHDHVVLGSKLAENLYAFALLPENILLAASRNLAFMVALVTLATVVLASGLLFVKLKILIIEPLRRLTEATRKIRAGQLGATVELETVDELGELAMSFNSMSAHLQNSAYEIERLAYRDSLTELPNRRLFLEFLQHAISQDNRQDRTAALLFLDLDDFKRVNDTLGHEAGDQLLREVARRLTRCLRVGDFAARADLFDYENAVARVGGDEFSVLLTDLHHPQDAALVSERIIQVLSQPITISNTEFYTGISIGIAFYPDDGKNIEHLLKNADIAMYHAKHMGKNTYQFYSASMNHAVHERLEMENALRKAIHNDELVLYYQPQIDLDTSRVIGVEALVRWQHPTRGLIAPDQFIPIAEDTGLIIPLGEWVLRSACQQAKAWQKVGKEFKKVAINISNLQLRNHRAFFNNLQQVLHTTGLSPSLLEIELTESTIMNASAEAMSTLDDIKSLGIGISMDDFGTGYSSLGSLRSLPVDTLKIDRSFVKEVLTCSDETAIVSVIIAMAKILKLEVIAEGVETAEQLAYLNARGCHIVQGYLISPPVPVQHINALFNRRLVIGKDKIQQLQAV